MYYELKYSSERVVVVSAAVGRVAVVNGQIEHLKSSTAGRRSSCVQAVLFVVVVAAAVGFASEA